MQEPAKRDLAGNRTAHLRAPYLRSPVRRLSLFWRLEVHHELRVPSVFLANTGGELRER